MAPTPGSISKIVILFCENHTYDNFCSDVTGGDGDRTLPLGSDKPKDQPHNHAAWMTRATTATRTRYTRAQLPGLYKLMDAYTVCDRYFADVATNSFPNHAFAIGADAEGAIANPHSGQQPFLKFAGVPVRLTAAGHSWANYGHGFAFAYYQDPAMHTNAHPADQIVTDAHNGTLPDVSWVYPPGGRTFHPGSSTMSSSDTWLHTTVAAIAAGRLANGQPLWPHLVFFVTFDDWGGYSDHVTPPITDHLANNEPYRYGSRVPCVVVSPYAKARNVSHTLSSHTSLVAYIERNLNLPASSNPAAHAHTTAPSEQAMADTLDLNQTPLPPPT